MLVKTTDYLEAFSRFKGKENVQAVERLISAHTELAKFERAQLGTDLLSLSRRRAPALMAYILTSIFLPVMMNAEILPGSLCCDTADEAKTLIPSLQDKISDDDLQELLDEITKLMGYGA